MVTVKDRIELCSSDDMCNSQCPNPAKWVNQCGVKVCDHHKLLLDAFTWEGRNNRKWEVLNANNRRDCQRA